MEPMNIVLIVLIGLLVIVYPIMAYFKNKKDKQKYQEMTNSFKRGDKVLTASGVYGTIIDLHQEGDKKIVTIETGMGKNKGYLSLDALAIYSVLPDEKVEATPIADAPAETEQVPEETTQQQTEVVGTAETEEK
ncbi:MAG: preprotein translocase subunit YajC [Clostridia bacterium]|nr:preprotein translocase subunit YajC [Clostridia bacterium]